jgi:hypothetical protein
MTDVLYANQNMDDILGDTVNTASSIGVSGAFGLLIIGLVIWTVIHDYRRYQKGQSIQCWCCCCWKECPCEGDANTGSSTYKQMNKLDTEAPAVKDQSSMFTGVCIV